MSDIWRLICRTDSHLKLNHNRADSVVHLPWLLRVMCPNWNLFHSELCCPHPTKENLQNLITFPCEWIRKWIEKFLSIPNFTFQHWANFSIIVFSNADGANATLNTLIIIGDSSFLIQIRNSAISHHKRKYLKMDVEINQCGKIYFFPCSVYI